MAPLSLCAPVATAALPWHNPLITSVFDVWCDIRVFAKPVPARYHLGVNYFFELTLFQHGSIALWDIDYTGWASEAAHKVLSHQGFARAFPSPDHYSQLRAMILEIVCRAAIEHTP